MSKTANTIAQDMKTEASASSLPASRVSPDHENGPNETYQGKFCFNHNQSRYELSVVSTKHPPTTKSKRHLIGIEFGFLRFRPNKSVRIELERLIVYRRVVEHFPMDVTRKD